MVVCVRVTNHFHERSTHEHNTPGTAKRTVVVRKNRTSNRDKGITTGVVLQIHQRLRTAQPEHTYNLLELRERKASKNMTAPWSLALISLIIATGSGVQLWMRLRAGQNVLHCVLSAIALTLAGITSACVVFFTGNFAWGMISGVGAFALLQIAVELAAPDDHINWWFSDRT